MSLINEALKKAQKQRSGEAPPLAAMPAIGGEPATRIARGAKATSFLPFVIAGITGAAVLVAAGFFLLRDRPAAPATTSVPAAVPTPAPAAPAVAAVPSPAEPATSAPSVAAVPASKPTAENTFVLPIAAPPASVPATEPPVSAPAVAAAPVPEPAAPEPAPVRSAEPGRLDSRAIQFIDSIKVAGIRASGSDSKVLMNDRVYRIGDMVEYDLGLRLVGITSGSLTFEDARGARHTRNF